MKAKTWYSVVRSQSVFLSLRCVLFFFAPFIAAIVVMMPGESRGQEFRTVDGTNNNLEHPRWGSTNSQLIRQVSPDYEDERAKPSGYDRPNVRDISNLVVTQEKLVYSKKHVTDMLWQWGQFLDHDLDLTGLASPREPFPISVPVGDPFFDPQSTGTQEMQLDRSVYEPATGLTPTNPRQQLNQITAFMDASMVYGSDERRAHALRTLDGTGRLKTSPGDLLPFNTEGLPNDGGTDASLFLAGDVRANEQVGLTAMHTLFLREHNRLTTQIRQTNPDSAGDDVYERARRKVGAFIQAITYNEFLPVLLGPKALRPYNGYQKQVNPGIAQIFSTAAYRLGHSMLSPALLRLDAHNKPIAEGHLPLREAFFAPWQLTTKNSIDPLLRGLTQQQAQAIDPYLIDDVRNFLFGPPGTGGMDLASMNLQRGRDHGLASYNDIRLAMGLSPALRFSDITKNRTLQRQLKSAYGTIEQMDVWIGGLAEPPYKGAMVGQLFFTILVDQFERLRDGDRFFYRNVFRQHEIEEIERTTLADIIRRNTNIGSEIQDHVFQYHGKRKKF